MSKVTERSIKVLAATVVWDGAKLVAKGPRGELSLALPNFIKVKVSDGLVNLSVVGGPRSQLGLYAALVANLVRGVTEGFRKDLELAGVGFRVKKEGRHLIFNLGFSHPVKFTPPVGCEVEVTDEGKISVLGSSKELVGQVAAQIRSLKVPEPYKGKGISYRGEVVRRKAGKAGKVGLLSQ